ncbi:MAG: hypothetical protein ABRQ26_08180 [Syntrophomonadaceae bacterium]
MLSVFLVLLFLAILIAVLVVMDDRFQSYFQQTRLGRYARPVFIMALALTVIALVSAAWVYKSAYRTPVSPVSGDRLVYNQLEASYMSKGVLFSEQAARQPDTKWIKGSNQDHSLNINIFGDKQLEKIMAYQVIVTTSAAGELPALIQTILPGWSEGPAWVAGNQNQATICSTSFQDTYIELCANSEGPKKALVSYYLGIYPHGYVDI